MIVADRPMFSDFAVILDQRVMRPGDGRARQQQDQRVEERQANGSKVWMPSGGQTAWVAPETFSGKNAKLKKAQKKATKNITSLEMNSVIP